jgi:hypothetical protein
MEQSKKKKKKFRKFRKNEVNFKITIKYDKRIINLKFFDFFLIFLEKIYFFFIAAMKIEK